MERKVARHAKSEEIICPRCTAYLSKEDLLRRLEHVDRDRMYADCYMCGQHLYWKAK